MLTNLKVKGFKNQKFDIELTGLDLFTSNGINGKGKSSRLEAAKLLALGHLPDLGSGNTLASVMKYTTGNYISVEGTFSGTKIKRTFGKKRLIKIDDIEVDYVEGHKKACDLMGFLPLMVDINEFINMSENKKKEFILKFSPEGSGISMEQVVGAARLMLLSKNMDKGILKGMLMGITSKKTMLELNEIERLKAAKALVDQVDENEVVKIDNLCDEFREYLEKSDLQTGLSAILTKLKADVSYYTKKVKENEAASKKLSAIGNEQASQVSGHIGVLKKEVTDLDAKILESEKEISVEAERVKAFGVTEEKIKSVEKEILDLSLRDISYEIKSATTEKDGVVLMGLVELQDRELNLRTAKETLEKTIEEVEALLQEFHNLNTQSNDIIELLGNLSKEGTPGTCLVDCTISCDVDLSVEKKRRELLLNDLQGKLCAKKEQISSLQKRMKDEEKIKGDHQRSMKQTLESNTEKTTTLAVLEEKLKGLKLANDEKENNLSKLTKEKEDLEKEIASSPGLQDPTTMKMKIEGLWSASESKKKSLEEMEKKKTLLIAFQEIKIVQEEDAMKLRLVKEAVEVLGPKGIQGELLAKLKGPLEKEVNEVLQVINSDMKFSIGMENGFEMGWWKNGSIVPFETLNDAHKVLMTVAFLSAIISRSGAALKLMCIEAAEMGEGILQLMLEGLTGIKEAGKLCNVMVAAHTFSGEPVGWEKTEL